MPRPLDLKAATADPEFQALPPTQQNRFLFENDPEARAQFFTEGEKAYGLPSGTLGAVWATESGRPGKIVSPTGVQGPFQITHQFWKDFGEGAYSTDPIAQLSAAGKGLAHYLQVHSGDLGAALNHYRNGSLDPSNKLSDPGYSERVLARIPKAIQPPTETAATTLQPPTEPPSRIMSAELSNAPAPPPGAMGAFGQATLASLKREQGNWEDFYDHPSLPNMMRVLGPAFSPGGYLGEVAAGTRARMLGKTPEETTTQEQVGNIAGTVAQAGIGSAVRRLAPLSGGRAAVGAEGLIPGGAKVAAPGVADIQAARDYLTPLRAKLANNPSALQAVETAAQNRWGADVLGAIDPAAQSQALPFSPHIEQAAGKLGKVLTKAGEHVLGAGLGYHFGHGYMGAVLGERLIPPLIQGTVKGAGLAAKTIGTVVEENPAATANLIGRAQEQVPGQGSYTPFSDAPPFAGYNQPGNKR